MQLYTEILEAGGPAFGSILRHVRDKPREGFIFHCTGWWDFYCILPVLSCDEYPWVVLQLEKIARE